MSFTQIVLMLRARLRLALLVFGGVVLAALLFSLLWPKQYTGVASVVVDFKSDPVAGENGGGGGLAGPALATYVNTQADIISSERVARKVVKELGLDQDPAARKKWATSDSDDISAFIAHNIIERKLTVAPVHDSPTHGTNVIDIEVKWSDPKVAADLANHFAQTAIDTNIELKVEPAKEYAVWFEQRSKALHADLEAKQKALSEFQNAHGIVATDEKLDVENARLTEYSTELVNIQSMRQESQSRQRQAGSDTESLPEVMQSPLIQNLKQSLVTAEAKLPEIASRLGKNHPDYQSVQAEIANLHSRIQRESANIAASLGNSNQVNVRREADARAALEGQRKRVMDLKHQHDQASVLESDVTSAQRDLDEVTKRLAESNLQSLTQQTNVVQLTYAQTPVDPSSPKLVLNMILGIFLGAVLGAGAAAAAEIRDRRVREREDLAGLLGVPVLGVIKFVAPSAKPIGLLVQRPAT